MLQRLKRWFLVERNPKIKDLIAASYSLSGQVISPRSILSHSAVLNGVRQISTNCGRIPYDVFDGKTREKDRTHPAQKTLKKPGRVNPITLITSWVENAVTHGNGYLWVIRDEAASPRGLELLDPTRISVVIESERIDYGYRTDDHRQIKIEGSDICHLRGLSDDGITGLPLCQILADAFGLGLTLQRYVNLYFRNNAKPSLVVHLPPQVTDPEDAQKFAQDWREAHTGADQFSPSFMPPGGSVEMLGADNTANQVAELFESDLVRIANCLGIPPHKIGARNVSVAYGSLEQENLAFLDAIDFWVSQIEQEFSAKLLMEREHTTGRKYVEGNRRKLVQITPEVEQKLIIGYRNNGLLSDAEARSAINRPTDFEGTFWLPGNLVLRETALEPPQPPPAAPQTPPEEPQDQDQDQDQEEPTTELSKKLTRKALGRLLRRAEKSGKIDLELWAEELGDCPGWQQVATLLPIAEIQQVLPEQRKYVLDQFEEKIIKILL